MTIEDHLRAALAEAQASQGGDARLLAMVRTKIEGTLAMELYRLHCNTAALENA